MPYIKTHVSKLLVYVVSCCRGRSRRGNRKNKVFFESADANVRTLYRHQLAALLYCICILFLIHAEMNNCLQLFKARKTIREMFYDRGYTVVTPLYEKEIESFAFWSHGKKEEHCTMTFEKPNKKAMVFFATEPKVGVAYVRRVFETLTEQRANIGVIVYKDVITPFANQEILKLTAQHHIECQTFKRLHLQINLTHHTKVPIHTILTKEEKDALLLKHNCPLEKLPHLPLNDKMAQYLAMKKGQVVKIQRMSPEGHTYFNYRVVVKKLQKKI